MSRKGTPGGYTPRKVATRCTLAEIEAAHGRGFVVRNSEALARSWRLREVRGQTGSQESHRYRLRWEDRTLVTAVRAAFDRSAARAADPITRWLKASKRVASVRTDGELPWSASIESADETGELRWGDTGAQRRQAELQELFLSLAYSVELPNVIDWLMAAKEVAITMEQRQLRMAILRGVLGFGEARKPGTLSRVVGRLRIDLAALRTHYKSVLTELVMDGEELARLGVRAGNPLEVLPLIDQFAAFLDQDPLLTAAPRVRREAGRPASLSKVTIRGGLAGLGVPRTLRDALMGASYLP